MPNFIREAQANKSDFDQSLTPEETGQEPVFEVPVVVAASLRKGDPEARAQLQRGMDTGCLWVDSGDHEALNNPQLWHDVEKYFDAVQSGKHWSTNRFNSTNNKYIEALMHTIHNSGAHYFERPYFQTSTMDLNKAQKQSPQCREDMPDSVKDVNHLMRATADEIFGFMADELGIETDYLRTRPQQPTAKSSKSQKPLEFVTMHRVSPKPASEKKVAAQEHYDFNTCNVLLYNYCQGFKLFNGETWYRIAEPEKKTYFLFNIGSVLSMKTNRKITALFHRVDTPEAGLPPRLAIVNNEAPALDEMIKSHPKFVTPGEEPVFKPHKYIDHVFYASSNYTKLGKHTMFNSKYKSREMVSFNRTAMAVATVKVKINHWGRHIRQYCSEVSVGALCSLVILSYALMVGVIVTSSVDTDPMHIGFAFFLLSTVVFFMFHLFASKRAQDLAKGSNEVLSAALPSLLTSPAHSSKTKI